MKKSALLFFFLGLTVCLKAQTPAPHKDTIQIHAEDITWIPAPKPLPPGPIMTVLEGDPKKEGFFTIRIKFPPHYMIPAHLHPKDERVTVLSGTIYVGFGNTSDLTKGSAFTAGSFYINPAGSHHYVYTKDEGAIVQITGIGPWGMTYCTGGK
jgi:quercetin dioxygenase-like cupin family protein